MLMVNCEIIYTNLKPYIAGNVGAYTLNTYCIASNYGQVLISFWQLCETGICYLEVLNQIFIDNEI